MKRRRRIEITRYSRRVTQTGDGGAGDTNLEQAAIDILLQTARDSRPVPEEAEDMGRHAESFDLACTPPRRPFFKLFDWLKR